MQRKFCAWLSLHKRPHSPQLPASLNSYAPKTKANASRAAAALRLAATRCIAPTAPRAPSCAGRKAQLGVPQAITATAHKLARIIYAMLRYGQAYLDVGAEYYESQYRQRALRATKRRAAQLGYQLVPMSDAEAPIVPHATAAAVAC